MKMALRPRCFLVLTFSSLIAADLAAVYFYTTWAEREFSRVPSQPAEVIAVLFQDFGAVGGLSKESQRRVKHAYQLYSAGLAKRIVCVGGSRSSLPVSGAVLMRQALIDAGVSEEHVLTAPPSFDSTDSTTNLEAIWAAAEQHNWQSVAVVSASAHLLRVRYAVNAIPERIHRTFHGYDRNTTQPTLGFVELWQSAHYEWGAWLLTVTLSREQLQALARTLRY